MRKGNKQTGRKSAKSKSNTTSSTQKPKSKRNRIKGDEEEPSQRDIKMGAGPLNGFSGFNDEDPLGSDDDDEFDNKNSSEARRRKNFAAMDLHDDGYPSDS